MDFFRSEFKRRNIPAEIVSTGCIGVCAKEPLVDIQLPGQARVLYANVMPEMVKRLVEEHIVGRRPVREWMVGELDPEDASIQCSQAPLKDLPLFSKQMRIAMRNCGIIDPERIEDYAARGGYLALARVLGSMTPEAVIAEVKASGLRGRGGRGIPDRTKVGAMPQIRRHAEVRRMQRR